MKATATSEDIKTIILVHGAFADGSSWSEVIPRLQEEGLEVIAVQNPLTSLAHDVAATNRAIDCAKGDVVLVGHSWGGAVITEAGNHDRVQALVYVAAFAPSKGQSCMESGKDFKPTAGLKTIKPDKQGFACLTPDSLATNFAQDLSREKTSIMAATQGPINMACFDEKLTQAAWLEKPSWYIVSEDDRMINPDLQRFYAEKIDAMMTSLPSSHVAMLSHPEEVAEAILSAAGVSSARDQAQVRDDRETTITTH